MTERLSLSLQYVHRYINEIREKKISLENSHMFPYLKQFKHHMNSMC